MYRRRPVPRGRPFAVGLPPGRVVPALTRTDVVGRVEWLGLVPSRAAGLASVSAAELRLDFAGPAGEDHGGAMRPSCSRVLDLYPRGTEIRNTRQLALVGTEELAEIAEGMGLERLDPAWLGATMALSGIPDFSHLLPSARLQFDSGATITVDMQNRPCHLPGPVIARETGMDAKAFRRAARGRRGVTAWVERVGDVRIGDGVRLHVPDQRVWRAS